MDSKEEAHIKRRIKEMRQRERQYRNLTIWYSNNTNRKKRNNHSS
jgi:hypothetical protein